MTRQPTGEEATESLTIDGADSVIVVDPTTDPRWAALVESRQTSVFAAPAWSRVLQASYGFPIRAQMVLAEDGRPVAAFAYAEIDDIIGSRIAGLPFSDWCDPIVDDLPTWRRLVEALLAKGCRIDVRCLTNGVPTQDQRFEVINQAAWHGIDLRRSLEDIWDGLHAPARRAVRKADATGVTVRLGADASDVDAFYRLHVTTRKYKHQLLAQPQRFFEAIADEFISPGDGFVLLAEVDGETVGGILFLEWQGRLYYKFNASLTGSLAARPNDRLLWEAIRIGVERNLDMLDLGLSDLEQEGLVRYKRKYATAEQRISQLRFAPPGWPDDREVAARALFASLTDLLVDEQVPDTITARAGDILYRYFS